MSDFDEYVDKVISALKEILEEQRRIRLILQDNTDHRTGTFKTTSDKRDGEYHIRYR